MRATFITNLLIESLERRIEDFERTPQLQLAHTSPRVNFNASQSTPVTPSLNAPILQRSSASQNATVDANSAVADLMSLPHSYFHALVDVWFKEDHHWVPILEYDHLERSLAALPNPVSQITDVVLRAVIALKVAYSSQAISLGYHGRRRLSLYLRSQVVADAMSNPCLDSIRALFIIALLDFGSDNIPSTLNIMSMCRRTGEHIGIFRQLLQRIEAQSPHQVGPPSRDVFTKDNAQIAQTWAVLSFDAVCSLSVSWRDVTADLVSHLSGIAYVSVPDFRDSFVTHVHLAAIGIQPVHEFFYAYGNGQHQILEGQTVTVTEDMYQNLMSYVYGLPSSGYTILANGAVDFDINHVFTRILSNAAVIMIYQRYIHNNEDPSVQLATDRCMESYYQIIDIIRNISDTDAEVNSPSFSSFVAVAARFRLVLEFSRGNKREPAFDVLMHGINMCGRRWPLARRIDIVLRAAIVEVDTGVASGLPNDFWDLRKSGHDISEACKTWVTEYKPSVWVGSLNGPYA